MFGRWELGAFLQTAAALARAMADGVPAPSPARRRPTCPATVARWGRPPTWDEPAAGDYGRVSSSRGPLPAG